MLRESRREGPPSIPTAAGERRRRPSLRGLCCASRRSGPAGAGAPRSLVLPLHHADSPTSSCRTPPWDGSSARAGESKCPSDLGDVFEDSVEDLFAEPEAEPGSSTGEGCFCRRRRSVRNSDPGRRAWWWRLVVATVCLCVVRTVAEVAVRTWQSRAARMALVPVRVWECVEYAVLLAAPSTCAAALHMWRHLELPNSDGPIGQRIVCALKWTVFVSMALVAVLFHRGDVVVRIALVLYVPSVLVFWVLVGRNSGLQRFGRIWWLFVPLIFEYKALWWWTQHVTLSDEQKWRALGRLNAKYAPRVFWLLVDLGGVFVKIGQLLSLLPAGVLPEAYIKELKKLQNTVPPRPGDEVRELVEDELGCSIESVFSRFDDKPIGSASIGQVHRARLRKDGREVVVKVQYPEVSQTIEPDFNNCERIVWFFDKTRCEEVREAKKYYINELDFMLEARTLERVRSNLAGAFPAVRVPEPVMELCKPKVLVMTFLSGSSLLDGVMRMAEAIAKVRGKTVDELIAEFAQGATADAPEPDLAEQPAVQPKGRRRLRDRVKRLLGVTSLREALGRRVGVPDTAKVKLLNYCLAARCRAGNVGKVLFNHSIGRLGASPLEYKQAMPSFDPTELSATLWRVLGHQLFVDGLFSTDPHPGNILIGRKGDVGLIDFGQVCELSLRTRLRFARLILALHSEDSRATAQCHAELGYRSKAMLDRPGEINEELLALAARLKFGDTNGIKAQCFYRYRELTLEDPCVVERDDEGLGRVERMINIIRGTSLILGVWKGHCPTSLWLDIARDLLQRHADHPDLVRSPYGRLHQDSLDEVFYDAVDPLDFDPESLQGTRSRARSATI